MLNKILKLLKQTIFQTIFISLMIISVSFTLINVLSKNYNDSEKQLLLSSVTKIEKDRKNNILNLIRKVGNAEVLYQETKLDKKMIWTNYFYKESDLIPYSKSKTEQFSFLPELSILNFYKNYSEWQNKPTNLILNKDYKFDNKDLLKNNNIEFFFETLKQLKGIKQKNNSVRSLTRNTILLMMLKGYKLIENNNFEKFFNPKQNILFNKFINNFKKMILLTSNDSGNEIIDETGKYFDSGFDFLDNVISIIENIYTKYPGTNFNKIINYLIFIKNNNIRNDKLINSFANENDLLKFPNLKQLIQELFSDENLNNKTSKEIISYWEQPENKEKIENFGNHLNIKMSELINKMVFANLFETSFFNLDNENNFLTFFNSENEFNLEGFISNIFDNNDSEQIKNLVFWMVFYHGALNVDELPKTLFQLLSNFLTNENLFYLRKNFDVFINAFHEKINSILSNPADELSEKNKRILFLVSSATKENKYFTLNKKILEDLFLKKIGSKIQNISNLQNEFKNLFNEDTEAVGNNIQPELYKLKEVFKDEWVQWQNSTKKTINQKIKILLPILKILKLSINNFLKKITENEIQIFISSISAVLESVVNNKGQNLKFLKLNSWTKKETKLSIEKFLFWFENLKSLINKDLIAESFDNFFELIILFLEDVEKYFFNHETNEELSAAKNNELTISLLEAVGLIYPESCKNKETSCEKEAETRSSSLLERLIKLHSELIRESGLESEKPLPLNKFLKNLTSKNGVLKKMILNVKNQLENHFYYYLNLFNWNYSNTTWKVTKDENNDIENIDIKYIGELKENSQLLWKYEFFWKVNFGINNRKKISLIQMRKIK